MRSYLTHAAIAALLLATSASNVFAAARADHNMSVNRADHNMSVNRTDHDLDPGYSQPYPAALGNQMPSGSITRTMTAPMYSLIHYDPRLARIVHELAAENRRIDADSRRGYLTNSEVRKVRTEEAAIRSAAFKTAERHGGAIPMPRYVAYQNEIRDLGHTIHRLSANSARV